MLPAATTECVCSRCGARNRVSEYDVRKAPICGRCRATLQERQSVVLKRTALRSIKGLAGVVLAVAVVAGVLVFIPKDTSKPRASCATPQPPTGRYARYDRSPLVAPLTIRTGAGADYFIKFEELSTRRTVMTLFARGGETIEQNMPEGLFKLKYATGIQWCGEQQLFGAGTAVSETDKVHAFDNEHAYTIELIPQRNGNLPVRSIGVQDF